ncbi:MFS transporter [Pseudooceanicola sp. CBS1P-1]|uniref:MFS transporter n=2 Tax=Paracoccaceae TaxID=31989 RepID=A0A6L7G8I8_9RHOB|nr:MFS transporter [Pseudooceanicola endophyticus]MXN19716.1 MFS transporter [Pseudooceanicola albus]
MWFRIAVLFLAGLGAAGQFGKISVLFPAWAAAYPGAGASLGFLLSLISLMGVVLGLVAGLAVARLGFRRMLVLGLAFGAVLSCIEALMPPLPVMMGLRVIEGLSHLVIVVAAPTLMAEIADDRARPVSLAIWSTYFGVAFALYAVIGHALLALGGLPAVLLTHAAWMAAFAVIVRVCLPEDRPFAGNASFAPLALLKRHGAAYRSAFIATPGLGFGCYAATYMATLTVMPAFFRADAREGLMTVLPMAGIVTSLTLGAYLLRRHPAVKVVVWGFGLSALGALCLALLPQIAWAPVLLFCVLGLVQGGSFASVPQINLDAEGRALSNGVLAQMGNLGNFLGTPVLLAMTGAAGESGFLVFALVLYGLGAAIHVVSARMRARGPVPA